MKKLNLMIIIGLFIIPFVISQDGCVDSDDGLFNKGICNDGVTTQDNSDYCVVGGSHDGWLREYSCGQSSGLCGSQDFNCPGGCDNGACIINEDDEPFCEDSDGGKNTEVAGTTRSNFEEREDSCLVAGGSFKYVVEHYCENGQIKTATLECPNKCGDGKCIGDQPPTPVLGPSPTLKPEEPNCYPTFYAQCHDGSVLDGEICKDNECEEYAKKFCEGKCSSETGKCGLNSFKVYNTCNKPSINTVCGNGVCEDGGGKICKVSSYEGPVDKNPACYTRCPQDCEPKITHNKIELCEKVYQDCINGDQTSCSKWKSSCSEEEQRYYEVKLDERFRIKVGGEIKITNNGILIQLLGIHRSGCDKQDNPVPDIEVLSLCKGGKVVAKLKITPPNEKSRFLDLNLGEKKDVFGMTLGFLDYLYLSPPIGIFYATQDSTECPTECICTLDGNMECPQQECRYGYNLCPDGECKRRCDFIETEECKFGCLLNENSCLPIGTRNSGQYCGIDRSLQNQKESEDLCENDFECKTNSCLDGRCTEPGFWDRIFKLLSGVLG